MSLFPMVVNVIHGNKKKKRYIGSVMSKLLRKNLLNKSLKVLLSEPSASLITFFGTSLTIIYHNSQ